MIFFQVDKNVNLDSEFTMLSAPRSKKSMVSVTSSEELSSLESSFTGISFTSSTATRGDLETEESDQTCAMTDEKLITSSCLSPQTLVSDRESNNQLANIRENAMKDNFTNHMAAAQGRLSKKSKPVEESSLNFKPNSEHRSDFGIPGGIIEICRSDKHFFIQNVYLKLQQKIESEDLLTRRLENVENALRVAENKADYWFNQCVKKGAKIKELLTRVQKMNFLNTELLYHMDCKSKTKNEKDNDVEKITNSKTETGTLLQKVSMKLPQAYNEAVQCRVISRQNFSEDDIRSSKINVYADKTFKEDSSRFFGYPFGCQNFHTNENSSENQKCMGSVTNNFYAPGKGNKAKTEKAVSLQREKKILFCTPNNSESQERGLKNSRLQTYDGQDNSQFPLLSTTEQTHRKAPRASTILVNTPLKTSSYIFRNRKTKDKTGITSWLDDVVRCSNAELFTNNGTTVDHGSPERSVKFLLRRIFSYNKNRMSKNETMELSQSRRSGFKNRLVYLSRVDRKGNRTKTFASSDLSMVTSNSKEYFSDVFLTTFDFIDLSFVNSLASPEPFFDLYVPGLISEGSPLKKLLQSAYSAVGKCNSTHTKAEVHLGKKDPKTVAKEGSSFVSLNPLKQSAAERKEHISFGTLLPKNECTGETSHSTAKALSVTKISNESLESLTGDSVPKNKSEVMSLLDKFTKRANTDLSKPRKEFASQILKLSKTQQPKGRGMERKYDFPLSSGLAEKFYIHKTFRQENVRNTGLVCRLDARESKKDITKRLVKKKPNQVDVEKERDKAINKNIGQTTTQSQNKNSSEFLSSTNSHMCLKRKCKERSNLTRLQTLLCSKVHRPQAGKSPSPMLQNQQEKGEINTLTQMWRTGNRDHNKLQKQF